jgi:hypothetical protein
MIHWLLQSTFCIILCPLLVAHQVEPSDAPADVPQSSAPAPATASPHALSDFITIPQYTKIELISLEEVSSATATKGQFVRLAVVNDVLVNGMVVIPKGTLASGVVSYVIKGAPGKRDGYLSVEPRIIFFNNGKTIKVSGTTGSDFGPNWFAYTFLAPLMLMIWILIFVDKVHINKKSLGKDFVIHVCESQVLNGFTANQSKIQLFDLPYAKSVPENAIPCKLTPKPTKANALTPKAAATTYKPIPQTN